MRITKCQLLSLLRFFYILNLILKEFDNVSKPTSWYRRIHRLQSHYIVKRHRNYQFLMGQCLKDIP